MPTKEEVEVLTNAGIVVETIFKNMPQGTSPKIAMMAFALMLGNVAKSTMRDKKERAAVVAGFIEMVHIMAEDL